MKLSEKTVDILRNFAGINENILIPATPDGENAKIRTRNVGNNIFAEAEIDERFPEEVRIYNLTQLLNVLGMFEDPDFDFQEKCVVVSGGNSRIRYNYASKKLLHFADKSPKIPEYDVVGELTASELKQVREAARHLNLPNISIIGEDGDIYIAATDISEKAPNEFKSKLECEGTKEDFRVHFSVQNLLMIPADYKFNLCLEGISVFENEDYDVSYAIAMRVEQ